MLDINYKKYLLNQSIESNGIIKNNINNEEDSVIKKKKDLNSKIKTIKKKKVKIIKNRIINKCKSLIKENNQEELDNESIDYNEE